jgi:hypothetical protein
MGLTLLTIAGSASALPGYGKKIPNGEVAGTERCEYCHTEDSGGPRTAFGLAYENNGSKWKGIEGKDSDGDGQLNSDELGDPCGAFLTGGAPGRTSDISDPTDKNSKATNPKAPDCMAMGSASGGNPIPTATGTAPPVDPTETTAAGPGPRPVAPTTGVQNACAAIAPTGTGGALGALWLGLGGLALRRRARRRAS